MGAACCNWNKNARSQEEEKDVKPNQEEEKDVKPSQEEKKNVKPSQEGEIDVKPSQDGEIDVKPSQEEKKDVKPSQEEKNDVKPNQEEKKDVKPSQEEKKDVKHDDGVVTRYEIREMSKLDQMRIVAAIKQMMVNQDGPETSEWFRCAGYHGWPSSHCTHGRENFPGWHRAYLLDLEMTLQAADKKLGNDGRIGLPYWDWTRHEINGEVYPNVLFEEFKALPKDFFKPQNKKRIEAFTRYSLKRIAKNIKNSNLKEKAYQALETSQHWKAASTRWRGTSVESPHNTVHVACGFPMATVSYAAFDPTFWLHHCNVDRLYESYIQIHPDSNEEYSSAQQNLKEQGGTNLYTQPYEPFKLNGKDFMAKDSFDIKKLGHKYDTLIEPRPQQIRQVPTLAVFNGIDIMQMEGHSYILNVFVHSRDDVGWSPPSNPSLWDSQDSFAGIESIFGLGEGCENCRTRDPWVVTVDITAAMDKLGLSRSEASLCVITVDEQGNIAPLEQTNVPPPVIEGPYFQQKDSMLTIATEDESKQKTAIEQTDVIQLQHLLAKFGWYEGECDSWFGDKTATAVANFQRTYGLKVDSIAGPKTKGKLMAPRFDSIPDVVSTRESEEKKRPDTVYATGDEVLYWVGTSPGYLKHDSVLSDIAIAINQWKDATGINFKQTETRSESKLNISWGDRSADNDFFFDGEGGALAHAGSDIETKLGFVVFDMAEKWFVQENKDKATSKEYMILPVVLHEIGHVLGLNHSLDPSAVMWAYYVPDRIRLTSGDVDAVKSLYQ